MGHTSYLVQYTTLYSQGEGGGEMYPPEVFIFPISCNNQRFNHNNEPPVRAKYQTQCVIT